MKSLEIVCYYSNGDSVPSPDHADMRSPSEVSSGVTMDTGDKMVSPSDSGTVSPNNKGLNGNKLL